MTEYGFNKEYLTKDKGPWFPMMGEFHYSRYPEQYWKESLLKMKAGGIEIVSSYVIWIHHEEVEGEYDFSGQRNLRRFVEIVGEAGLKMFLRIGPWCHGEVRNGGFPDWLLQKEYEVRSNEEGYFDAVGTFYKKIYEQVEGLLYGDGGPVIGVQIENEYGHCGGLCGEEGEEHMRRLTRIAQNAGFILPYYTATGWGGAATGGILPVMGGYCEAPWDQRLTEIEPSGNYVFTRERNDHNIGSDLGFGAGITYDIDKFPYLTAELGGGLQVTHHRRPVARGRDIGAMSMVKLGSGVNLLGYYMYHGGTNPKGKKTTLQESRETGYPNDLPIYSYDFSAPIREYGQISDTFKEIKLLAMFLKDWEGEFCRTKVYLTESNPEKPQDLKSLRSSVRRNGEEGFLFVNNYQRRYPMAEHPGTTLTVDNGNEIITFPKMDIHNGDYFFYPFYMRVGDGILRYATGTPLCRYREEDHEVYVFYSQREVTYQWIKEPSNVKLLTLSKEQALNAYKIVLDREYLIICEDAVVESVHGGYEILQKHAKEILTYPKLTKEPKEVHYRKEEGDFSLYTLEEVPITNVTMKLTQVTEHEKEYELSLAYPELDQINDCFLQLEIACDKAKLYVGEELEGDFFYTGEVWEIGMKRFGFPEKIRIVLEALKKDAPVFLEKWPEFDEDLKACKIRSVSSLNEVLVKI